MVHLPHAYMSINSAFIHLTHLPKTQKNDNCVFRATRPYPANRYRRPPQALKFLESICFFFHFAMFFIDLSLFWLEHLDLFFFKTHSIPTLPKCFWDRCPKQTLFIFGPDLIWSFVFRTSNRYPLIPRKLHLKIKF